MEKTTVESVTGPKRKGLCRIVAGGLGLNEIRTGPRERGGEMCVWVYVRVESRESRSRGRQLTGEGGGKRLKGLVSAAFPRLGPCPWSSMGLGCWLSWLWRRVAAVNRDGTVERGREGGERREEDADGRCRCRNEQEAGRRVELLGLADWREESNDKWTERSGPVEVQASGGREESRG